MAVPSLRGSAVGSQMIPTPVYLVLNYGYLMLDLRQIASIAIGDRWSAFDSERWHRPRAGDPKKSSAPRLM